MPENKHLKFFIYVAYAIVGYFVVTRIFPMLWTIFLPFLLAFVVAAIAHPLVVFLRIKGRFPKWLATLVSLLLILVVLSTLIGMLVNRVVAEFVQLANQVPGWLEGLSFQFNSLGTQWSLLHERLSPEQSLYVNDLLSQVSSTIMSLAKQLASFTVTGGVSIAKQVPNFFIFVVAFILASVFMTGDYEQIKKNLMMQLSAPVRKKVYLVKHYSSIALTRYLRGMGIILLITFTELLVGFFIAGIPYAFVLAIIIALVDVLPVFGTGTILVPWAAVSLLTGDYSLALCLAIIYVVVTVVRQLIEPKVMSKSLGTYPLVTLFAMYVGLKLFGVKGMIFGPIVMLVLLYLQSENVIRFWKGSTVSLPQNTKGV